MMIQKLFKKQVIIFKQKKIKNGNKTNTKI